jgi:hypothetical protein
MHFIAITIIQGPFALVALLIAKLAVYFPKGGTNIVK